MASNAAVLTMSDADTRHSALAAIARGALWTLAIMSGLQVGASLYELFVITPLWSSHLPEAVTNWNVGTHYPILPGMFWAKSTPVYAIAVLGLLVTGWFGRRAERRWMLSAAACGLVLLLVTSLAFLPAIQKTLASNGAGLTPAEISRLIESAATLQYVMTALGIAGWAAAMAGLLNKEAE